MPCPHCGKNNDADALFCASCGTSLVSGAQKPAGSRRPYLFMLVLVPVAALVMCLGYYKFLLPDGIVAVVNGENITRSELEAAVARSKKEDAARRRTRYETLNTLITERIILQEARKAGIRVSAEDVGSAVTEARLAAGGDEEAFRRMIDAEYGGMAGYEDQLGRRLAISRYLSRKIGGGQPHDDGRWLQELVDKASVRIALVEEVAGQECAGACGTACAHSRTAKPPDTHAAAPCNGTCGHSVQVNR